MKSPFKSSRRVFSRAFCTPIAQLDFLFKILSKTTNRYPLKYIHRNLDLSKTTGKHKKAIVDLQFIEVDDPTQFGFYITMWSFIFCKQRFHEKTNLNNFSRFSVIITS